MPKQRPPAALAGMLDLDALTAARKKRTQQKTKTERPLIPMDKSGSRRRGGGSLEEGAGTETGQNLANLMGSIVKESTTGKRYAEEGTHGQFKEGELQKALQQDLRNSSEGGKIEGVPPLEQDWHESPLVEHLYTQSEVDDIIGPERSKGSRGHFDAGHA